MYSEVLQNIYKMKTDGLSSGEVLKRIYEEESKISSKPCYLPPYEVANALTIKDLKRWLFLNPFNRINTYSFRKTIDRIKSENLVEELYREYPAITAEQIGNVKEMLLVGRVLYDDKTGGTFEQIYRELFGDFDEIFQKT